MSRGILGIQGCPRYLLSRSRCGARVCAHGLGLGHRSDACERGRGGAWAGATTSVRMETGGGGSNKANMRKTTFDCNGVHKQTLEARCTQTRFPDCQTPRALARGEIRSPRHRQSSNPEHHAKKTPSVCRSPTILSAPRLPSLIYRLLLRPGTTS